MSKGHPNILDEIKSLRKKHREFIFWESLNSVKIISSKLQEFLITNDFYLLKSGNEVKIIRLIENIIIPYTKQEVFNFCYSYVKKQKNDYLSSKFLEEGEKLLITKKSTIGSLNYLNLREYKDNKKKHVSFFRNSIVVVRKHGIKCYNYKTLKKIDKYIFLEQIKNRSFKLQDSEKSQFKEFIKLCSFNDKHFLNLCSSIGYLIHKYKNPSIAKAVIISDYDSQKHNEAFGRSGKGLIIRAIDEHLNVCEINGKHLDNINSSFMFQNVSRSTDLIVFQDVNKNFKFENLFSSITDKFSVEKKYLTKEILNFDESPKISVTTNYVIPFDKDSYKDRAHLIILKNYFNSELKPVDYFKNLFFLEWDSNEYNLFDNFILNCCKNYLNNGLTSFELLKKELVEELFTLTSIEFVNILDKLIKKNTSKEQTTIIVSNLSKKIKSLNCNKFTKSKIISKWLKIYFNFHEITYRESMSQGRKTFIINQ